MYMLLEREGEGCYLSAVVFIIVYNQARKCSNLIYKNTDIDTKKKKRVLLSVILKCSVLLTTMFTL